MKYLRRTKTTHLWALEYPSSEISSGRVVKMTAKSFVSNVYITTKSNSDAKSSSFLPLTPPLTQITGPTSTLSYIYSTLPSLTLTGDADLANHLAIASSGPPYVAFPVAGASVACYMNFAPNPEQDEGFWHRTQTVDYIVMLEGSLELTLSGGEKRVVKSGDVVVQRAAMHKWKNLSPTEGARYVAVLLGAEGAVEGGIEVGESDH